MYSKNLNETESLEVQEGGIDRVDLTGIAAKNDLYLDKGKRNLKEENVSSRQDFEYLPGTNVYFGSTIALKARHGGYLSFHDPKHVKASAHILCPTTSFIISNCDDPTDIGLLRYGDAVWLQAGVFEVLGADFGSGAMTGSDSRKIVPALINSRRENLVKAHQYGRWIVLRQERTLESLGEPVNHLDKVILEQEW